MENMMQEKLSDLLKLQYNENCFVVDYIVDYNLGTVSILNQGLLETGTPIKISLESNSMFSIGTIL